MNSSLYKRKQLLYLSTILRCNPKHIEELCLNISLYYRRWEEVKISKETGKVKSYLDGTPKIRVIQPSDGILKEIQRSIKTNILAKVELPPNVHGAAKKRSNITNSKVHQGNKYKFGTDLQDFFPNINHNQIYEMYLRLGYSNHVAQWLTKLTTFNFQLPQGTPTSSHASNLVFIPTDWKLIEFCKTYGITYTRYIDDLFFSSQQDFRHLTHEILQIVTAGGEFKISYRKTLYSGNQTITGVEVFNNYIDGPNKIKLKAKEEIEKGLLKKPLNIYLNNIRKTNTNIKSN